MINDDLGEEIKEDQVEFAEIKKMIDGNLLGKLTVQVRAEMIDRFYRLKDDLTDLVLANADVVATTCVGSWDARIKDKVSFSFMLMDEATQACQPEILIPLMTGITHACLVGDNQQLGPVVKDRVAEKAGLKISMYRRIRHKVPQRMLLI